MWAKNTTDAVVLKRYAKYTCTNHLFISAATGTTYRHNYLQIELVCNGIFSANEIVIKN
jgi:hypothetical protein